MKTPGDPSGDSLGDQFSKMPAGMSTRTSGCDTFIDLVHEDEAFLILNKPPGLLSVPGRGEDKQDCLSARVQQLYPDSLVVHRLDMATSGLLLMARGAEMQRRLSKAFETRQVHKRYAAVVDGKPAQTAPDAQGWSVIDLPIAVDWPRRPLRVIDAVSGKPSTTRWRIRAAANDDASSEDHKKNQSCLTSRLDLEPITGRSHQLRVHLQATGHAILGDQLYADDRVRALSGRLLLHACTLRLIHPVTGEPVQFESPVPF